MEPLPFTAAFDDSFGIQMCDVRALLTLGFVRNQAPTFGVTLDIESDEAALLKRALRDGLPRLKVWHDGTLIANAPWAPTKTSAKDSDTTEGTVAAAFRGPFALLERRFTAASRVFPATDAGTIAWTMVSETNSAEGSTGIRLGTIEPTVTRDRTYEDKQIAEAVSQLTNVLGGFDFEIEPVDEGTICGAFNVMANQGQDRSVGDQAVVFEYGPGTIGNCLSAEEEMRYPVNVARVIGANGLRGDASDAASIAKYQTHMVIEQQLDVSEQATLDAKASALLQPDMVQVIQFAPDPELAPQPIRDYWLGDIVVFRARHGALNVDLRPRVNAITITTDVDGNIASTALTIDQAV